MSRALVTIAIAAIWSFSGHVASAQQPSAAPAPAPASAATPADADAFIGDWTVKGENPMGPFTNQVSVKVDAGKVVGAVSSDTQPVAVVTDVKKEAASLVLRYSITWEGNTLPAVLTLTPRTDRNQIDAFFSFADGAFEMSGVGTKSAATK